MALPADASLDPYLKHLRALPYVRSIRSLAREPSRGHRTGADARIELEVADGSRFELSVEVRRSHLGRMSAEGFIARARESSDRWLLVAPSIGAPLAQRLTSEGVNFVDRAGNCHVDLAGRFVTVIEGRTTKEPGADATRLRALRAPAYRVLFALLADVALVDATVRTIAAAAGGVSAQTASDLRHELVGRGLLLRTKTKFTWNLARVEEAIDLFVHGYLTGLRDANTLGRFRSRIREPHRFDDFVELRLADSMRWSFGGGTAAERLDGHYRGSDTVIHVHDAPSDLPERLELVPDARGGNVRIVRALGPTIFPKESGHVAHPLLVYADLLAEADERATEAARAIRRRLLSTDRSS